MPSSRTVARIRPPVAAPQRVLRLQRRDRVDGMGAADGLRARLRRAPGSGPCPRAQARPSRRPSPRSASRDRRGAGSRGRCTPRPSRLRLASHACRTYSGRPLTPRKLPSSPRTLPNFVASTTWFAPVANGAADQLLVAADAVHVGGVEEGHPELEGAMDRGDRLRLVAAAVESDIPMQPRPSAETRRPWAPSCLCSILSSVDRIGSQRVTTCGDPVA